MAYSSKYGRKIFEFASKTSHSNIINSEIVKDFFRNCVPPMNLSTLEKADFHFLNLPDSESNIDFYVSVDGGYSEVPVTEDFPSASFAFFQAGVNLISSQDLENLDESKFIDPSDMRKITDATRVEVCVPSKNYMYKENRDIVGSFREAIYDFFCADNDELGGALISTLSWLIFKGYDEGARDTEYILSNCPNVDCERKGIALKLQEMDSSYTFLCPECGERIYLTDVFRLFEAIDITLGAGGVLGYTTNLIEHFVLFTTIRTILEENSELLSKTLFIKDGPLFFPGQTAGLHKVFRDFITFLSDTKQQFYLVGIEKSGAFVDFSNQIRNQIPKKSFLPLNNRVIYKYISPVNRDSHSQNAYGNTSYYSGKVIYKTEDDYVYIATIPSMSDEVYLDETFDSTKYVGFYGILNALSLIRSDTYQDGLLPIAAINKTVSISQRPGSSILEKFAKLNLEHK